MAHKCEWAVYKFKSQGSVHIRAACIICGEIKRDKEIERCLNATSILSSDDAKRASDLLWNLSNPRDFDYYIESLRAYADALLADTQEQLTKIGRRICHTGE